MPLPGPDVTRRLLDYYDRRSRPLPWRQTRDPYAIWVSEVMLQQTRVKTVVPYYRAWMTRFPTSRSLADADLDEVLRYWAGLGYYSRARQLHRAARLVHAEHDGRIPDEVATLRELPGVGEYTAGAVASIAYGVPVPAIDGNVRRVFCRLFDLADPSPSEVRSLVADRMSPDRPGDFNQAIMDLGATICTPRRPACADCPVAEHCLARARGTVPDRPMSRRRAPRPSRLFAVAVPLHEDRLLVRQRPEDGLLGGLWEFPNREIIAPGSEARGVVTALAMSLRLTEEGEPTPTLDRLCVVRHGLTHFTALYEAFLIDAGRSMKRKTGPRSKWVPLDELGRLALPAAQRRIGDLARAAIRDARGSERRSHGRPSRPQPESEVQ